MFDLSTMDKRLVIFGSIFTLSNRLQTMMDQRMDELTAKQWFVLTMLEMFEQPPNLMLLATACDSSYQNIKQLVLKLEEKGFVQLINDPADKRNKRVLLTQKCTEWEQANRQQASRFVDTMFADLEMDEINELSRSLLKIYKTLGNMQNENQH